MSNYKYCVYVHTNKKNGKKYVGCTRLNPCLRWGINGRGYLIGHEAFSEDIRKYGWENFSHEILEYGISTQKEAESIELQYICKFNSIVPNGYNVDGKGRKIKEKRPSVGWHHSEDAKKKIGEASRRNKTSEKTAIKRSKPVDMIDAEGNLIKTFYGASEASRETGIDISTIAKCCKPDNRNKSAGGYLWKYHKTDA